MTFKILKKTISIFMLISFILTNSVYAAPDSKSIFKNKKVDYQKISNQTENVIQKKKAILNGDDANQAESQQKEAQRILSSHLSDISLIHLPPELGRIVEVYQGEESRVKGEGEERLIVHIQDLHTNPEAEYNLAKMLEFLLNDYKMGLVCSEGADGVVDTSSISSFPDYAAREKVGRIFINSGELTGEEYLSITKYPDLPIWGIENKDTYFKNILGFNKIMKFNSQSQVFISQVKKALEELKNKAYSKELLELDKKEADYKAQKLETADYVNYLTNYINKLNIPASNYKNISLLTETMSKEKTIDQLKVINESQNVLLNLQSSLAAKSLRRDSDSLMANAQLFKDQKISPFAFYSYLKDLAQKHLKDDFAIKYSNLNSFTDYLAKINSIDSTDLFLEFENLNFEIKQALSKTDEQKTLVKALRNINFLEGFFNLKISNEELDYYLSNKDSHKVAFFESFLKPAVKKYNINAFIDYNPALIDSHLQELEDFYKVVKERDVAMADNAISEIEKRNSRVSSLIAGGFHTKGITRILKEKGYSYIVVSPYSKTDIDEENYHFLLSGKRKPITDILKEFDLSKVVKELISTLRVPLVFDTDMAAAYNEGPAKELGTSIEDLIPQFALALSLAGPKQINKWGEKRPICELAVKRNDKGESIYRIRGKYQKQPTFIIISRDGIPAVITDPEFNFDDKSLVVIADLSKQSRGKTIDNVASAKTASVISGTGLPDAGISSTGNINPAEHLRINSIIGDSQIFLARQGNPGTIAISYQGDASQTIKQKIEKVITASEGLEPIMIKGIGLINIYPRLKDSNILWVQAAANAPPLVGESMIEGHGGARRNVILLISPSLEKVSNLTLARIIVEEQIELVAKQKALEQGREWTEDLAREAHQITRAYIDKKATSFWKARDEIQKRAVALHYILNQERDISLIPDLSDYPGLPKVKQPIAFNSTKNITTDVVSIILDHTELANVVFGLRPAALIKLDLNKEQLSDLEYALLILKHMRGVGIKILSLSNGRSYVYDEDYARAVADEKDINFAVTRAGLELLITKDIVSTRGRYFDLTQQPVSGRLQRTRNELADNILNKGEKASLLDQIEIGTLFIPTYERPDALDRALTAQTTNLRLFGLEYLPIIVADSSVNKTKEAGGKRINFVEENLKVINKHRARGFNVQYISSEEIETWKQGVLERLYTDYSDQLKQGRLDPRIQREIVDNGAVNKEKLKDIVFASLNIGNIAGKRTVIQAMTQGKKIATVDDDALPITRIPNIGSLRKISERRNAKVLSAKYEMYKELDDLLAGTKDRKVGGMAIKSDAEFEDLLSQIGSVSQDLRDEIYRIFEYYYAYKEDGKTGIIPQAAEQIIRTLSLEHSPDRNRSSAGFERRLRFDRILHQGLPEYLVVSEDTGVNTYEELPDLDNTEAYDWVPVNYLQVFDDTLGATVGSNITGRVFERDLRGTAGSVATLMNADRGKKVLLATSHFSGDRDNSAQGILTEAMSKFGRDMLAGKPLDTKYLQQVVRKAIFVEVNGSVSTKLSVGNQFCFNTASLDNTEFPIPTTGAWLRIEEPLQHTLIMFVMGAAMAWSRTVGGHERVAGSRRPKIEMQDLWEECAMVLYRELQKIFTDLDKEMEGQNDPAVRIRRLGETYLASAVNYAVPDIEKGNLRDTCLRVAEQANTLYAWSEYATGDDREELRSIFGSLDSSPFGYIKQFSLAVYEFKVNEDGHTATCTRHEPVWKHNWEPAKLVESYDWNKSEPETVDLSRVDWDNNPTITLKDGTKLHPVSYKEIPRAKPTTAGSTFMVAMADEERQKDLITKAQELIQKQFTWDGQQLLIWPDILNAAKGFDQFHGEWIDNHPYTHAQFSYDLEKTAVLIPAAGVGSRLWPASRTEYPKQLRIFGQTGRTMIQETVARASKLVPYDRIFISTTPGLAEQTRKQLPQLPPENIIVMPPTDKARETSVGMGNAAVHMKRILEAKGISSATMVILPSDHEIANPDGLMACLKEAISAAQKPQTRRIVTLGIKTTANDTAYGYVLAEEMPFEGYINAKPGIRFVEKPPYSTRPKNDNELIDAHRGRITPEEVKSDDIAEELRGQGARWNAGMFIAEIDNLLEAFRQHSPGIYQGLKKIQDALGTPDEDRVALDVFNSPDFVNALSIDFAIMKKLDKPDSNTKLVSVATDDIGWNDIGSWDAVSGRKDDDGNVFTGSGTVEARNCKNCIFYAAKGERIQADDLDNAIIVSFPDASLVVDRSSAQKVRAIIDRLVKHPNLAKFLNKRLVSDLSQDQNIHKEEIDAQDTDVSTRYGLIGVIDVQNLDITKQRGNLTVLKKQENPLYGPMQESPADALRSGRELMIAN